LGEPSPLLVGKAFGEGLMIAGPGNADKSFALMMLQKMVSNFVH
jgi:hypothetical protein